MDSWLPVWATVVLVSLAKCRGWNNSIIIRTYSSTCNMDDTCRLHANTCFLQGNNMINSILHHHYKERELLPAFKGATFSLWGTGGPSLPKQTLLSIHIHGLTLVRFVCILRSLQLNLQSFRTNLESVHGLDGALRREGSVETDKTKALAQARHFVNEYFSTNDVSEGGEHLDEVAVHDIVG